jgi:hypothetical protein
MSDSRRCKCGKHTGEERWHMKTTGYTYHGCRCDYCKNGWAQYNYHLYHR